MVVLRNFQSVLTKFNTGELLKTTIPKGHNVIGFDLPTIQNIESRFLACLPVFCLAVCVDCPKDLDPDTHLETYHPFTHRNEDFTGCQIASMANGDESGFRDIRELLLISGLNQFNFHIRHDHASLLFAR